MQIWNAGIPQNVYVSGSLDVAECRKGRQKEKREREKSGCAYIPWYSTNGSGNELEFNIELEGPYNQLGLSKNRYWQGNVSISHEADEGMFLSACDNIWEILNVVTEPPSFKDVSIQMSNEVHNLMASTWIKATVRNDVAQQ